MEILSKKAYLRSWATGKPVEVLPFDHEVFIYIDKLLSDKVLVSTEPKTKEPYLKIDYS